MTKTRSTPRLRDLGFLHMVPTVEAAPVAALTHALALFERGEGLGFDSAWVFVRHLQRGLSSPVAFLSAASQRTSRIRLGAAVIPLEYERLLTLAEGLATADLLSGGRLEAGVSTHAPRFESGEAEAVFGSGWQHEDYSYDRLARLRALLAAEEELVTSIPSRPGVLWSGRSEPANPALASRLWQGGGSLRSVGWAAANGFDLLLSNVATSVDGTGDYARTQRALIDAYRADAASSARVKVGLVVVPTEGATPTQRERFASYLSARAHRPGHVGAGGIVLAPDISGSNDEIVDRLGRHLAHLEVDEFLAILPFDLTAGDADHIVTAMATEIAPQLGWTAAQG